MIEAQVHRLALVDLLAVIDVVDAVDQEGVEHGQRIGPHLAARAGHGAGAVGDLGPGQHRQRQARREPRHQAPQVALQTEVLHLPGVAQEGMVATPRAFHVVAHRQFFGQEGERRVKGRRGGDDPRFQRLRQGVAHVEPRPIDAERFLPVRDHPFEEVPQGAVGLRAGEEARLRHVEEDVGRLGSRSASTFCASFG